MKGFDDYYQGAQVQEWRDRYINYQSFKSLILNYNLQSRQQRKLERRTIRRLRRGSSMDSDDDSCYHLHHNDQNVVVQDEEKKQRVLSYQEQQREFMGLLQKELLKATQFYQQTLTSLRKEIEMLQPCDTSAYHDSNQHKQQEELTIATKLLRLYSFVVANIITIRQVLLRYDAYKRTCLDSDCCYDDEDTTKDDDEYHMLSSVMFTNSTKADPTAYQEVAGTTATVPTPSSFHCLVFDLQQLDELIFKLPSSLSSPLPYINTSNNTPARDYDTKSASLTPSQTNFNLANQLQTQVEYMHTLLDQTYVGWHKTMYTGHMTKRDRMLSTIRCYYILGSQSLGFMGLEPKFLQMNKGRHLKAEMKSLANWNETTKMLATSKEGFTMEDGGESSVTSTESIWDQMDPANVWPLILNLISCFLFMMNNYIIEPSSAYYAEALGSSDALSGIMIGAAPWFALLSAIVYSIWTNTCYKVPILFAGTLMVIGNTLYAMAYSFGSIEICLVGRAITGLGAPRIINRRYVADATPFALRTMSSAGFALTTALGAAMGPGFAIVLDAMPEFEFTLPFVGTQHFNGMTGPGYFMAFLWLIYIVAVAFTFQEPNRSGLDELKRREEEEQKKRQQQQDACMQTDSFLVDDEYDDGENSTKTDEQEDDHGKVSKHNPMYCIKNMTKATALCMGLIFMKRIALEVRQKEGYSVLLLLLFCLLCDSYHVAISALCVVS